MNNHLSPAPRVLIADDEEGLLFLMVDALQREGWEAQGVVSGKEALTQLAARSADLLLLDLKLPDLSALELVERLRRNGQDLPFVIVTGHGDERTAVEAMKQGALDYVMKDAGMLELLPAIVRRSLGIVERERRLAEANRIVRQGEERHQHIIQTALDGFVRFTRGGQVLEINEALCRLFGCSAETLLSRSVFDAEGPIFREEVHRYVKELEPHDAARCSTRLVRGDGTEIDVDVSLRREGDEFFGFVHDVSVQRRLERQIQHTLLEERQRFGRELHDGLGQQLTALELMTHTMARELKTLAPRQATTAFEITNYIRHAITQTRELAHGLSPVAPEADGLMNALQELARMTSLTGVACEFQCPEIVPIHDAETAANLYRIAQEAVTNSLKHSKAKHLAIRLEEQGEAVKLSVRDDGEGLPRRKSTTGGMGLQVMKHRARLIGGQLTIDSAGKRGVEILCSVAKQP